MERLHIRGQRVQTFFHLNGTDEDSITLALAWTLSSSQRLMRAFVREAADIGRTP